MNIIKYFSDICLEMYMKHAKWKGIFGAFADSEGPDQTLYHFDMGRRCSLTTSLDAGNEIEKFQYFD